MQYFELWKKKLFPGIRFNYTNYIRGILVYSASRFVCYVLKTSTNDLTLRCLRVNIVVVEKLLVLHIVGVCLSS